MMQIVNRRKFTSWVLGVTVVVVGIVGWAFQRAMVEVDSTVTIANGMTANDVWQSLVAAGASSTKLPWRYHAWLQGAATSLQAGTYEIEQGSSVASVVRRMAAGDTLVNQVTLTFPEGFTLQQIADRTAARGLGTAEEFVTAATPTLYIDTFSWLREIPAGRSLEGYLFPDTYHAFVDDKAADVIIRMLTTFDSKVTEDIRRSLTKQGRSLDETIIMASIIEREVVKEEDMALVSGILWTRYDDGVGLDADATVRYAVHAWDRPLTVQDLAVDSPYNTRRYRGLPPGPISNPGLAAIMAATNPTPSDYYYYLSTPEGKTVYSRTNDEHNQAKAQYLN